MPRRPVFNPAERAAIQADAVAGLSTKALVEKYGSNATTIKRTLKRPDVYIGYASFALEWQEVAVREYGSGETLEAIGRAHGFSRETVANALRRKGVVLRKQPRMSAEDMEEIAAAYLGGLSPTAAAGLFGFSRNACYLALERLGITERHCETHHYTLNGSFFERIDTEAKAYWLGFIAGDGCIMQDRCVNIGLARKDRCQLEAFKEALEWTGPLVDRLSKGHPQSRVYVYSKKLAGDLIALGVTGRKSHTLRPWDGPAHLMRHYWRGLFDADGCMSKTVHGAKGRMTWQIALVGSLEVVRGFTAFVCDLTGMAHRPSPKASVFQVSYRSNPGIEAVIRCLYDNAPCGLPRKIALARQLMTDESAVVYQVRPRRQK